MPIQRTIGVRVSLELYRRLENEARRQGRTLTAFVRELLLREVDRLPANAVDQVARED
jgi:predicted DNA-binding protein